MTVGRGQHLGTEGRTGISYKQEAPARTTLTPLCLSPPPFFLIYLNLAHKTEMTEMNAVQGTSAVVINRPLALGVGPKLAELLYEIDDQRPGKPKDEAGLDNEGGTMRRTRAVS